MEYGLVAGTGDPGRSTSKEMNWPAAKRIAGGWTSVKSICRTSCVRSRTAATVAVSHSMKSPRFALALRTLVPHVADPFQQFIGSGEVGRTAGILHVVNLPPPVGDDYRRRRNPFDSTCGDDQAGILRGKLRLPEVESHGIGVRGWIVVA